MAGLSFIDLFAVIFLLRVSMWMLLYLLCCRCCGCGIDESCGCTRQSSAPDTLSAVDVDVAAVDDDATSSFSFHGGAAYTV
jgi:hypothetical protein